MSDISQFYGGSILACRGKSSVVVVSDKRLGQGSITVSTNLQREFQINPLCVVLFASFQPDCFHFVKRIRKQTNLFKLKERRDISPRELANMISFMLYEKRWTPLYVSPIVAGIQDGTPVVISMDCLGSLNESLFVSAGTAENNLIGMCESLISEEMETERLATAAAHAFLNGIDRDALSGWGCQLTIIEPGRTIRRMLKARMDWINLLCV